MADFRKWLTVLAVLALMAVAASAQVGIAVPGGSASSLLACTATAAGTPQLRPESYTDLAGDIVISCTGGPDLAVGSQIPTTNIVVYISPDVPITSRLLTSSGGASEALLIIDDAGSNLTGAVTGFGPSAPQSLCTLSQEHSTFSPTSPGPCTQYVGVAEGTDGNGYEVAVGWSRNEENELVIGTTATQNVFQGSIGDYGPNTVTFYNVPVLPPATAGVYRTFRITNVRVGLPGVSAAPGSTVSAYLSASPSQALPISQTSIAIGNVGPPSTSAVGTPAVFKQCQPQSAALADTVTFTEGFATAFKTRVVPGGVSSAAVTGDAYAAEAQNLAAPYNQNIPGGLYGGLAANSESGFIFPALSASISGTTYYAGLADFGTRLKAVFTNVPTGLSLYVSTTSISGGTPTAPGDNSTTAYAVLVDVNGSESGDGSAFTPIASTTTGADGNPVYGISAPSSGEFFTEWEVVNANPSAIDTLTFGIYVSYTAGASTTANPYGTPITGNPAGTLPPGSPIPTVSLSFAPEPSNNSFTAANGAEPLTFPIPRFVIYKPVSGNFLIVNLCQTTLLYPFVTAVSGFDTGIAVANTSLDPWNYKTLPQTGSCTLYGYGVTVANGVSTVAAPVTVPGCDTIANGASLAGTGCFGGPVVGSTALTYIPAGQVGTFDAAGTPSGPTPLTGFQGYVIAVCNFEYAHGYAAVTDLGVRNLWSSYLALELASGHVGSQRPGTNSVEILAH